MRVEILPDAVDESIAARHWYEDRDPRSVAGFQRKFEAAIALLQQYPNAGSAFEGRTRRLLLLPYPYSLIYQVFDDFVLVVAVAHVKQRRGR